MTTETVHGIEYSKPEVILLQETGIGVPEIAARSCYDSFDNSENDCIRAIDTLNQMGGTNTDLINNIEHSDLLDTLAWTHFHHSILEHANLSYLIKGTSRGVLQEEARHRMQAISVRSTRYTMQPILNAFIVAVETTDDQVEAQATLRNLLHTIDFLVTTQFEYKIWEYQAIYYKLRHQWLLLGREEFLKLTLSKDARNVLDTYIGDHKHLLLELLNQAKSKRNVGDPFKHIVTDNWKVDMVVTFNLRSLKNFFQLRDSGSAYFQIRWLAQAMKEVTPSKYLDLIVKS